MDKKEYFEKFWLLDSSTDVDIKMLEDMLNKLYPPEIRAKYDKQIIEDYYGIKYDDFLVLRGLFSHHLDVESAERVIKTLCIRLFYFGFDKDDSEYKKYQKEIDKIKVISGVDCFKYAKDKEISLMLAELASRWGSLRDKDKTFICETLIGRFKSEYLMNAINELSGVISPKLMEWLKLEEVKDNGKNENE